MSNPFQLLELGPDDELVSQMRVDNLTPDELSRLSRSKLPGARDVISSDPRVQEQGKRVVLALLLGANTRISR